MKRSPSHGSWPCFLVALLLAGCYPVRNPVRPGPAADSALNSRIVAPVRDPADDPDTVSPVELDDTPGDAGSFSPGAGGFGRVDPPEPEPVRVGPSPATLDARRRTNDVGGGAGLRARQAEQRRELDARREPFGQRASCCLPANPRARSILGPS